MSTGKQKTSEETAETPDTGPTSQSNTLANVQPSNASESSITKHLNTGLGTLAVLVSVATLINQGIEDGGYNTPLLPCLTGKDAGVIDEFRRQTTLFVNLTYQHDRPLKENEMLRDFLRDQYRKLMQRRENFNAPDQKSAAVVPEMKYPAGWNPHLLREKLFTMFARIVTQEMVLASQRFDVMASKRDEADEDPDSRERFEVSKEKYESQAVEARAKLEAEREALIRELGDACRELLGRDPPQPSDSEGRGKDKQVAVILGPKVQGSTDKPFVRAEDGDREVTLVTWDGA